jgi:hypothetical protein
MSGLGHSRPGPAGRRSSHVRYAPKATVGHQNAIGRDGPGTDSCTAAIVPAAIAGNGVFLPAVGAGCKASAHIHHSQPPAPSVLPH